MQRQVAENLISNTRHLIGQTPNLQVLDVESGHLTPRRVHILANDLVVNLKSPEASRVCCDVYAQAEDLDTSEVLASLTRETQ